MQSLYFAALDKWTKITLEHSLTSSQNIFQRNKEATELKVTKLYALNNAQLI